MASRIVFFVMMVGISRSYGLCLFIILAFSMLDGRPLHTHELNSGRDSDDDTSRLTPDSHSTATYFDRARSRKDTTSQPFKKVPTSRMAGSNIYDRLEGGLGTQVGQARRKKWKKYAIIAVLFIGVLWLAAPHSESYIWNKNKGVVFLPFL